MTAPHLSDTSVAALKVVASRERLRLALSGRSTTGPRYSTSSVETTTDKPDGLSVLKHAARSWWEGHPLHLVSSLAGSAAHAAVEPIAQKHPVRLLVASAAVGGLIAYLRPWRLLAGTGVVAVWVPKLVGKAAVWAATAGTPAPAQTRDN